MNSVAIKAENLTKAYPGVVALNNVSFEIQKGDVVGVLGPNGSGKTTLLRILTGYLSPTSGFAYVNGMDVGLNSLAVRKQIGYFPETNPLYNEMRISEYLFYRASIKGIRGKQKKNAVGRSLTMCGLVEHQNRIIGHLSKGLRQRVGIADAIIADPPILILDEPTIGLDPAQALEMRTFIKKLLANKTVLISSHILPEIDAICKRMFIFSKGKLVADGTKNEIIKAHNMQKKIRVEIKGNVDEIKDKFSRIEFAGQVELLHRDEYNIFRILPQNNQDIRSQIYQLAAREGWQLREIGFEEVSLEEIFIKLTS